MLSSLKKYVGSRLSTTARCRLNRILRPRVTHLPFRRLAPLSTRRGFDRGQPIDRYYIECHLQENSSYVRGRCLEVRDATYTHRFGAGSVTAADILDIDPRNPSATIVGDLCDLKPVGDDTYDCIILTQVLQYVPDAPAAVRECHRILKQNGALLLTVPLIAAVDPVAPADFWRFTPDAVRLLLRGHFAEESVDVRSRGNHLATVAFLMGLAREELGPRHLGAQDDLRGCIVSARAVKSGRPDRPAPLGPQL